MSLKRTRMMETPFLGDMEVDSARSMKRRCFQQEPPHEHDLPKYSQRQFEFLDQAKQAEMSRLRYLPPRFFINRALITCMSCTDPSLSTL